ncbi:MAG: hypothetical protein MSIBF_02210 [Candidatus Altiarchaeales archaeon IMC4]|nr:MAG: hypothetical protein MSIBF_02210 [Candidatus Altiarchaeales archaeon IMC4]
MDLHPHEIRLLKALTEKMSPQEAAEVSGLPTDAVMRASSWLSTKKLIGIEERIVEEITLTGEGMGYAQNGLPERRILDEVRDSCELSRIKLDRGVVNIGLGWLRKKNIATLDKGVITVIDRKETGDEKILKLLKEKGKLTSDELDEKQAAALSLLRQRQNVVDVREKKIMSLSPTKEGIKLGKTTKEDTSISQLTPEILKSGAWKTSGFRPYDVDIYVKPKYPAKKHPLRQAIDEIRAVFLQMGFTEITGPLVESAFWNFDVLFQPQDHPARDMHDTFYLGLEKDTEELGDLKDEVKAAHEGGWTTGSKGWGYEWDEDVAKKMLLRTHTTAVTARRLSTLKKEDLPVKVFSIGKTFRNEAIDYKHLPEFYQVEGIIAAEGANFRNLLDILKNFYMNMGFEKVRFRPAYFPYTEMSIEPEIYLEERGEWVELGGAGIFRPEVVKPLLDGFECPVLAWGLGLDRVVALKLGLTDIRELYLSDIDWLRKCRV